MSAPDKLTNKEVAPCGCDLQDELDLTRKALSQAIGLGRIRLETSRNHTWLRGGDYDVPEFKAKTTNFPELTEIMQREPQ